MGRLLLGSRTPSLVENHRKTLRKAESHLLSARQLAGRASVLWWETLLLGLRALALLCIVISVAYEAMKNTYAQVAELADALASGASDRKIVGVQVPPCAQRRNPSG